MFSAFDTFLLPFRGINLILIKGLRKFVIAPLVINLLLYSIFAWIGYSYFDDFINWLLPEDSWLSFLEFLLWPLFALSYLILTFYSFTILANILAAPFNGLLAEKVEEELTGKLPPRIAGSLIKDLIPSMMREISKLSYFLTRAIPILILMLIPGVNVIGSVIWLLFGFWFLTIEYADYTMENHGIHPKDQRKKLRAQPIQALAFGAGASLLMMIPILSFAAMPASVAAGTMYWVRHLNPKQALRYE
ncbi:MAG: sulfate transporter CysZ [Gammaproteobacteria bacterium]|nr:sulfate transporter CysZ [Gammaproteobacteria bacterium]